MSPNNRLLITERLTRALDARDIVVVVSHQVYHAILVGRGYTPSNDDQPHGVFSCNPPLLIVTHDPLDELAYSCLLHEMGHAFDPLIGTPTLIARELTAWKFVLTHAPTWSNDQDSHLRHSINSYVTMCDMSNDEVLRLLDLMAWSTRRILENG